MPQRKHLNSLFFGVSRVIEVVLSETEKNAPQVRDRSMTSNLAGIRKFLDEEKGGFEFFGEGGRIFVRFFSHHSAAARICAQLGVRL
jgi:hypothetical protein